MDEKGDRSNRCARQIRLGTALAALCVLYAAMAYGQATNSGDITGTVTDSTGAILPGVSITVLDVDKNVTHTYTSNEAGAYDTGPIVPYHYILTSAKEGFAAYKRGPTTVSVGVIGIRPGGHVGASAMGTEMDLNAYTRYYELRIYDQGPFRSRPDVAAQKPRSAGKVGVA